MAAKIKEKIDASVEGKLKSLYQLQLIDSKIHFLHHNVSTVYILIFV